MSVFILGKHPIIKWDIKSRSEVNPDTGESIYWNLGLWGDGKLYCDCPASQFRRKCHHVKEKQEELIKEYGNLEQAIIHFKSEKNALRTKQTIQRN